MKNRCYYEKSKDFKEYGGRGITVCHEWLDDFGAFKAWALNSGYSEGLTIERIDVNKGYSPDNCRWATNKEQQNNKRRCYLTYGGVTHTHHEWAEITGISTGNIASRLFRGWTVEEALTKPARKKRRKL